MRVNQNTDLDEQDEVVVIEERDKRSHIYIAIAAVIGIALGGLVGSAVTTSKWEASYQTLENQYQALQADKSQLVTQVEQRSANVDSEVDEKIAAALKDQDVVHQQELVEAQQISTELEKANLALESQLAVQKAKIEESQKINSKLNRQADMQATMFEGSRDLFRRELKVSQELEALQTEKNQLEPKLKVFKKECDIYLDGTSWDAKSDSCDKQDEVNSRLSQINQMIEVHKMDLRQIEALTDEMGL